MIKRRHVLATRSAVCAGFAIALLLAGCSTSNEAADSIAAPDAGSVESAPPTIAAESSLPTSTAGDSVPTQQSTAATASTGDLKVGIEITPAQDAEASAAGVAGSNGGDQRALNDAIIAVLNAEGGSGGRKITPVYYERVGIDSVTKAAAAEQAACEKFVRDEPVEVVLNTSTRRTEGYYNCLGEVPVPIIAPNTVDAEALANASNLFVLGPTLDDAERTLINRLWDRKFLTADSKVGVVIVNDDLFRRAYKTAVIPALQAKGLTVAASAEVDATSLESAVASLSSSIVQFKDAGVDRVIAVADSGLAIGSFMFAAGSAQYTPQYAFTTNDTPAQVLLNVPPELFAGAMGIGWQPSGGDVSLTKVPTAVGDAERCLTLLDKAGLKTEDLNVQAIQLATCDTLFTLDEALDANGGKADLGSLSAALVALGDNDSAYTTGVNFSKSRAGVAVVRDTVFDATCKCLAYVGTATSPIS
jgi:hypothetical protein